MLYSSTGLTPADLSLPKKTPPSLQAAAHMQTAGAPLQLMDVMALHGIACHPVWNDLPGTALLGSPVRTEFSTGLFQAVFIWLSMEFSSGCRDQQV